MADNAGTFRGHVLTMYGRCNNDLTLMCERIAKVLQDSGRPDVNVSIDGRGTVVTMAQSIEHSSGREVGFEQRLNKTFDPTRPNVIDPRQHLENAVKDPKRAQDVRFVGANPPDPNRKPRRCFPKKENDWKLEDLPTSQFNGNYTLKRYGGFFPDHCHYGFYRRYGMAGQGAATAEFHNLPNGLRPNRDVLYH